MSSDNYAVRINLSEGIVELEGPDKEWIAAQLKQLEPVYAGGGQRTSKPARVDKTADAAARGGSRKTVERQKPRRRSGSGSAKAQVAEDLKAQLTAEKKKALERYIAERQIAFDKTKQNQAAIIATFLHDELGITRVDADDLYTVYRVMGIESPGNPGSQLNNAADRNKFFGGRVDGKRELSHKGENFGRTGSLNTDPA